MGGLITNCNPQDLPEGASPRTWDTDFIIGSVFTRAGLRSVYAYASNVEITSVVIGSGSLGTFTYTGRDPVVNEEFLLNGFTGSASFLSGQNIVVIFVNAIAKTFIAEVKGPAGTYTGLHGIAISTTGLFVGPNVPEVATDVPGGTAWTNPNGILGNTSYASTAPGLANTATSAGSAINFTSGTPAWTNPNNLWNMSSVASVTLSQSSAQLSSVALYAIPTLASLPSGVTVQ